MSTRLQATTFEHPLLSTRFPPLLEAAAFVAIELKEPESLARTNVFLMMQELGLKTAAGSACYDLLSPARTAWCWTLQCSEILKKIMLEFCTRYHFLIRLSIILQKLILKGGFSRDLVLRHGLKIFLANTIWFMLKYVFPPFPSFFSKSSETYLLLHFFSIHRSAWTSSFRNLLLF